MFQKVKNIIKIVLIYLSDLGILSGNIEIKAKFFKLYRRLWTNRKLKFQNGYYKLDPMPEEYDLNQYYTNEYWNEMGGKNIILHNRDIDHFKHIHSVIGN